jgi:hypothetical protein
MASALPGRAPGEVADAVTGDARAVMRDPDPRSRAISVRGCVMDIFMIRKTPFGGLKGRLRSRACKIDLKPPADARVGAVVVMVKMIELGAERRGQYRAETRSRHLAGGAAWLSS